MAEMIFDELHVVSDLHFGGKPGFQIFNQADTLAATIRTIASTDANRKVGFVMNGDIVDFLAEQPSSYLDPAGAIQKLQRIFGVDEKGNIVPNGEKAFNAVWEALREYVKKPNRYLVMVLGNHDVELALPPVTEWLLQGLSKGDEAARGRILIHLDGAGFSCKVHTKKVLCVHGNEGDPWNYVDYWQLLKLSQSMNRCKPLPDWKANAGTQLVIDVMNDIKKDYPMVDLLKPEMEAALPIVLVLKPEAIKQIKKLLKLMARMKLDEYRHDWGFLSAEETGQSLNAELDEETLLTEFMSDHFNYRPRKLESEDLLGGKLDDISDISDEDGEFLGPVDYFKALFGKKEHKSENMRRMLKDKLEKDTTFSLTSRDEIYEELDEELGSGMDYLIAGHTHLERAFERDVKGRYYYNSGTWIRLIHLKPEFLESQQNFDKIWRAFSANNIEALDGVNDLGPGLDQKLVLLRPTVVSIIHHNGEVHGQLSHASEDGNLDSYVVPNSIYPRRE